MIMDDYNYILSRIGLFLVILNYLNEIYGVYEAFEYALKSMAWQ